MTCVTTEPCWKDLYLTSTPGAHTFRLNGNTEWNILKQQEVLTSSDVSTMGQKPI
ncbi:hypothetical protein ANANG_G00043790 [Anguilla anguilla]|uniref:Uncharacterized protein n=1 Tax=Anguilla anguilla TaxID=7936 RepID=A0A9D3MW59_ANGAN|nr:hypothetical protein ANANG_G00043790 [Anguilla anguilla]